MDAGRLGPAGLAVVLLGGCLAEEGSEIIPASSYTVKATASHDVQGAGRTIEFSLLQNGKQLGKGDYSATNSTTRGQVEVFNATVEAGKIYVGVFPESWFGSVAIVDRVLDVAKCPTPLQFNAHVLDDDVQLTTNCD
ncbi:MAG: hypothetical protein WC876_03645 [Candidatus Thermoplasmatota archaeon]